MPTAGSTDLQTALKVATGRDRIAEDERLQLAAPLKEARSTCSTPCSVLAGAVKFPACATSG